jgi:hypothetical protein
MQFRIHSRLSAVTTTVSCALHLTMIGRHGNLAMSVLMVVMVAFCLPCILHLWRSATLHATRRVTTAALVMVGLHLVIVCAGNTSGHAHAGAAASHVVAQTSAHTAVLSVLVVELVTAMTASSLTGRLLSSARRRGAQQAGGSEQAGTSLAGVSSAGGVSASFAR